MGLRQMADPLPPSHVPQSTQCSLETRMAGGTYRSLETLTEKEAHFRFITLSLKSLLIA